MMKTGIVMMAMGGGDDDNDGDCYDGNGWW